jgi:hypothetical protein
MHFANQNVWWTCKAAHFVTRRSYESLYRLTLNENDLRDRQTTKIKEDCYCRFCNDKNKTYCKPIDGLHVLNSTL